MNKKLTFYLPRILSLLFVGFISLFSLDVFGSYHGLSLIIALFMHLLLPALLLIFVLLAWKFGIIGAVVFTGFAILYGFQVSDHIVWILLISGPSLIAGVLYFVDWYSKYKHN